MAAVLREKFGLQLERQLLGGPQVSGAPDDSSIRADTFLTEHKSGGARAWPIYLRMRAGSLRSFSALWGQGLPAMLKWMLHWHEVDPDETKNERSADFDALAKALPKKLRG